MAHEKLKEEVYAANMALQASGLVVLTWGNASGVDRAAGVMAIKPSGVSYDVLKPADIVVLSLEDGRTVDGKARPSSDTPTHLHLYQKFATIGGVIHTHSTCGTSFAQAGREIPCLGTTHADNFYGTIPCTRQLTDAEINGEYELNTGKVMVERFVNGKIDPLDVPGILVAGHAPFAWGENARQGCRERHRIGVHREDGIEHVRFETRASSRSARRCSISTFYESTARVRTTASLKLRSDSKLR